MMSLTDLSNKHGSDKASRHSYTEKYEELFSGFKEKAISLLEVGVLHGGSMMMWRDYFPNGQIHGVEDFSQGKGFGGKTVDGDATEAWLNQQERITLFRVSCMDVPAMHAKIDGRTFDFIIDDGCHSQEQQLSNIASLLPLVKPGGVYVCEDVQHNTSKEALETAAAPLGKVSWYEGPKTSDDRLMIVHKNS
jgi:cephalosporin hydroxylase